MKNVVRCVECTRLCGVMCVAVGSGVCLRAEVPVSPACGLGSCGAVARAYTVLTGTVPPPRGAGAPLRTPQRPGGKGGNSAAIANPESGTPQCAGLPAANPKRGHEATFRAQSAVPFRTRGSWPGAGRRTRPYVVMHKYI